MGLWPSMLGEEGSGPVGLARLLDVCLEVLKGNIAELTLSLKQKNDTLLWLDNLGKAVVALEEGEPKDTGEEPEAGEFDQMLKLPPKEEPPSCAEAETNLRRAREEQEALGAGSQNPRRLRNKARCRHRGGQ